jgi:cholesterol transport system auxiliary component
MTASTPGAGGALLPVHRAAAGDSRANARAGRWRAWLVVPAILLSACTGSLLESDLPANSIYVLVPAAQDPALRRDGLPGVAGVDLSIGRPHLAPGLNTDRIAVLKGQRLDYYRAVRWGAPAAEVVQSLLIDSLQDQQLFNSVSSERARIGGAYLLDIDVRDFQAEYAADAAAPAAHVYLTGRLIRVADRRLVRTFIVHAREQASQDRMGAVIAAFESAGQQVALSLARQASAAIESDLRRSAGGPDS